MSLHTNFHAPGTSLSGRIQIGHKSGLFLLFIIYSVNTKPPRHRFGFSLAWGWQQDSSKCNLEFIKYAKYWSNFIWLLIYNFLAVMQLFTRQSILFNSSHWTDGMGLGFIILLLLSLACQELLHKLKGRKCLFYKPFSPV